MKSNAWRIGRLFSTHDSSPAEEYPTPSDLRNQQEKAFWYRSANNTAASRLDSSKYEEPGRWFCKSSEKGAKTLQYPCGWMDRKDLREKLVDWTAFENGTSQRTPLPDVC